MKIASWGSGEKYYFIYVYTHIHTHISSTDIHTVHKETLTFHEGSMELGKTSLKRLYSGVIMKKRTRNAGLVGLEMDTSLTHTKDKCLSSCVSQPPVGPSVFLISWYSHSCVVSSHNE